jgi:hypothetical protein
MANGVKAMAGHELNRRAEAQSEARQPAESRNREAQIANSLFNDAYSAPEPTSARQPDVSRTQAAENRNGAEVNKLYDASTPADKMDTAYQYLNFEMNIPGYSMPPQADTLSAQERQTLDTFAKENPA